MRTIFLSTLLAKPRYFAKCLPPPPRKAASSLRVVHANLWHVLLLMIGLNAFSESYIIAQGCGPTGSVVYNCN